MTRAVAREGDLVNMTTMSSYLALTCSSLTLNLRCLDLVAYQIRVKLSLTLNLRCLDLVAYQIRVKLNCDGAVNFGGLQAGAWLSLIHSSGDFVSAFVVKLRDCLWLPLSY
jgi:hypothetical protein